MFSNEILPKFCSDFLCEKCDYRTSKKSSYDDHLLSRRHQKAMFSNEILPKFCSKFVCPICSKEYKDNSGLWRHKKKCKETIASVSNTPSETLSQETILNVLKQNSELQLMLLEQNRTIIELSKNAQVINNTNSHNKTFNLQFFLNETCKDAMNIMDFVDSIQLQLNDLTKVGEIGYVEGISNIITNNLKALDVTQRPIHCTDRKREILYVKDDNQWEKDTDGRTKIKSVIKQVANKNMKKIPDWVRENPDCYNSNSKNNDKYLQIVSNSMSGSTVEEQNINLDKIISKVAKEVAIDKL